MAVNGNTGVVEDTLSLDKGLEAPLVTSRVVLESPFANSDPAKFAENIDYLRRCIRSCIAHGESPYASHRMLTDALDDNNPAQRTLGIDAGFLWRHAADVTVVYIDRGISKGMVLGIQDALKNNRPMVIRAFDPQLVDDTTKLRLEVLGLPIEAALDL